VVPELDLDFPPDGHDKREFAVPEAIEIQGAVQSREPGDQLESGGPGARVRAQPCRIHVLLLPSRGSGDPARQQQRESEWTHSSILP
jgi:hypothetical protein